MMFTKFFPIIHVNNLSDKTIEKLYFKVENTRTEISIKNIKPNRIKSETILTKDLRNEKNLVMYYYDHNDNKHEHIIFDKLIWGYNKDIKIEITGINEDNSYNLKVEVDVVES